MMSEVMDQKGIKPTLEFSNPSDTDTCKICQNPCDPYKKPALLCRGGCSRKIHIECLKRGSVPASFVGDVFFELNCCQCSPLGEETVARNKMPWLNVIVLTLYNLREKSSGISKRGYFHWKSDISTFVDRNWDHLFKKTVKRKKNWIGTISGTLSHYSGIFFKSGTMELGESGWWRLIDNDPPEVLIAKNEKMIMDRKKGGNQSKQSNKTYESPTPSESSISVGEDSNCGNEMTKNPGSSTFPQVPVQPTKTLFDFLLEEDELNNMQIEDDITLNDETDAPSFSDLINDCQYQTNNFHFSQLLDDFASDWTSSMDAPSESVSSIKTEQIKEEDEEQYEEDSNDSMSSVPAQPPASLFKTATRRQWPWERNSVVEEKLPRMTHQEEAYLLQQVNKSALNSAPPHIRRFYRKLAVRKLKREYGLPLLDIHNFGSKTEKQKHSLKDFNRVLDRFFSDDLGCLFEQRLQGYNEPTSVLSPYTNRILKPFIRRDTTCRPLWLRVMEELRAKANRCNPKWKAMPKAPIDYSYVRPQHIPAINSLCSQFFWPGIDCKYTLMTLGWAPLILGFFLFG